jgi:DNA (cytosine-5)-methyltransferase 1
MEQLDMFEVMYDKLPTRNNIKLGTFFSGIGAPEMALTELSKEFDFNYESMFYSEIDKYAIKGYCAIHNQVEDDCLGSITDIKGVDLPYCDIWVGGFPCQDISLAGKGKGFDPDSETRSSLGFEMIRLLKEVVKKPMYVLFENVANITSENKLCTHCKDSIYYPHERICKCGKTYLKTNLAVLQQLKNELKSLGYTLNDDKLNAKDYGIPQNRNRYFLVAILGEYSFKFPNNVKLELRLKDMLEDEVEEKYYLSDKAIAKIYRGDSGKFISKDKETCGTIIASYYKIPRDGIYIEDLKGKRRLSPQEVYRLMGFENEAFERAEKVISNTQLYKTGGNSIVVKVLKEMFKNLFRIGEQ